MNKNDNLKLIKKIKKENPNLINISLVEKLVKESPVQPLIKQENEFITMEYKKDEDKNVYLLVCLPNKELDNIEIYEHLSDNTLDYKTSKETVIDRIFYFYRKRYSEKDTSIFISLILRHKPEIIKQTLSKDGFLNVDDLITGMNNRGYIIDRDFLDEIISNDKKKRYSYNADKTKIRANQGHSIKGIVVDMEECIPPDELYHGTAIQFLNSIRSIGIKSMQRNDVHLSKDIETAINVGKRHGKPVVLIIDSKRMYEDSIKFRLSENKVWLTDYVDPRYFKKILMY